MPQYGPDAAALMPQYGLALTLMPQYGLELTLMPHSVV